MNMLYYSTKKNWGGITSWMVKTARGLKQKGHNVWIFSHPDSYMFKKEIKGIKLVCHKHGMDFNPWTILKLYIFIKKHHINLIVTNIKKEVSIAGFAAKLARIPNLRRIGTEHDYDNPTVRRLSFLVDYTLTPCKFMSDFVIKKNNFLNDKNTGYIYNGRDIIECNKKRISQLEQKFAFDKKDIIIGVTCQLSKTKNVKGILNVFYRLCLKYRNLKLVIAGDGPQKENLGKFVLDNNLVDKVIFVGFVDNPEDFACLYDIGLLFSYKEGFSNSVVEYLAASTAVICTDTGGQNEIIRNGYNGFLIESGNENQLENALGILIKNPQKRVDFAKNGIKTVQEQFSEEEMIIKLEKLYKKVINLANYV